MQVRVPGEARHIDCLCSAVFPDSGQLPLGVCLSALNIMAKELEIEEDVWGSSSLQTPPTLPRRLLAPRFT